MKKAIDNVLHTLKHVRFKVKLSIVIDVIYENTIRVCLTLIYEHRTFQRSIENRLEFFTDSSVCIFEKNEIHTISISLSFQ